MGNHSSTSNSNSGWRRTLFIALAFLIFGTVALSLAAQSIVRNDHRDRVSIRFHILESQPAEVLFIGSSLSHFAFNPAYFEEIWDVPEGGVVNLSGSFVGLWETDALVSNTTQDLNGTLVILEVDPWTFNEEQWHPVLHVPFGVDQAFRGWAPQQYYPGYSSNRLSNVVDRIVPALRIRRALSQWARYITGLSSPWPEVIPRPDQHQDEELADVLTDNEDFQPDTISHWHLKNYRHSEFRYDALVDIIDRLTEMGAQVVLVMPPVRDAYFDDIRSDSERWPQYQTSMIAFDELQGRAEVIHLNDLDEIQMTSDMFIDYGHVTVEGGRHLSTTLARILAERELGPPYRNIAP